MTSAHTEVDRAGPAADLDRLSIACLAILAGASAVVGLWALLLPESFFRDFPLGGLGWVAVLPPYNEHLVRDVGGLTTGMAALLALAASRRSRLVAGATIAAWLVANVPHTVFHLAHLDGLPPVDAAAQSASLLALLALACVVGVRIMLTPRQRGS